LSALQLDNEKNNLFHPRNKTANTSARKLLVGALLHLPFRMEILNLTSEEKGSFLTLGC